MIHIIGLGVSAEAQLSSDAQAALESADWVIGSERQLQVIAKLKLKPTIETKLLPPLRELAEWLQQHAVEQATLNIAVLASGDPLFYGIGRWFSKKYPADKLRFYPAVSSIQAACHQLGLSLQDVDVLSLHGRPLAQIRKTLKPAQTLVVLSDKNSQPQVLAQECIETGFAESSITVCENLGYPEQKITHFDVRKLSQSEQVFDPLHLSVITVKTDIHNQGLMLPSFPGIPDAHFVSGLKQNKTKSQGKGMLTKREVRLAILSLMQANDADVIWDVGAGCGSVAVELAYWNKRVQVYAIEHNDERLGCLRENRERFGVVSQLNIIEGTAPSSLSDLPAPSKVFIGGSDGRLPEILQYIWNLLPEGGVLVASAVTETTKQHLIQFMTGLESKQTENALNENMQSLACETLQIAVSQGSQLAGQLLYRPNLPVTLFKFTKLAIVI